MLGETDHDFQVLFAGILTGEAGHIFMMRMGVAQQAANTYDLKKTTEECKCKRVTSQHNSQVGGPVAVVLAA